MILSQLFFLTNTFQIVFNYELFSQLEKYMLFKKKTLFFLEENHVLI